MSDDKLKEIADEVASSTHSNDDYCLPGAHQCPLYQDILAALQQARDLGREEEHAVWMGKQPSVAEVAKAAFERGREEERKEMREDLESAAHTLSSAEAGYVIGWLDARSSQGSEKP
jgi:hypothetical protein